MAAAARAIDETRGGKIFLEFVFSNYVQLYLCVYLFVSLHVDINILSSYFLALKIFQGFSLNLIHESNCENFRTRR